MRWSVTTTWAAVRVEQLERFLRRGSRRAPPRLVAQQTLQRLQDVDLVVDEQDGVAMHAPHYFKRCAKPGCSRFHLWKQRLTARSQGAVDHVSASRSRDLSRACAGSEGGSLPRTCRRAAALIRAQDEGSSPPRQRAGRVRAPRARSRLRDFGRAHRPVPGTSQNRDAIRCHAGTRPVHSQDMTKICSWCQGQMVIRLRRPPRPRPEVPNYGMCGSCLEAELEALARSPRRRLSAAR